MLFGPCQISVLVRSLILAPLACLGNLNRNVAAPQLGSRTPVSLGPRQTRYLWYLEWFDRCCASHSRAHTAMWKSTGSYARHLWWLRRLCNCGLYGILRFLQRCMIQGGRLRGKRSVLEFEARVRRGFVLGARTFWICFLCSDAVLRNESILARRWNHRVLVLTRGRHWAWVCASPEVLSPLLYLSLEFTVA